MTRTITQPADHSSLSSSVVRNQLQLLENEVADPSSIDPGHLHTPAGVSATGTPGATTFWRGDNVWAVPTGTGGTGTQYDVSGTCDGTNVTFTIPVEVGSDFLLWFERQSQFKTDDYTYTTGGGATTITYVDGHQPFDGATLHRAFVIS